MPFTIDFLDDGRILEWVATADGAVATKHDDYTPRFYVAISPLFCVYHYQSWTRRTFPMSSLLTIFSKATSYSSSGWVD